jgi:hypothetical protein
LTKETDSNITQVHADVTAKKSLVSGMLWRVGGGSGGGWWVGVGEWGGGGEGCPFISSAHIADDEVGPGVEMDTAGWGPGSPGISSLQNCL